MDFRELTYVLAIAKHQNITKAAESLYVSQPTLSKFLIALEHDLGLKLFRRMGHRYMLTYAGERYVEKAREILRLKADLDAELADIVKRDVGVLNVAFAPVRCSYMLPYMLPAFQSLRPNVKVNVFEGSSTENDRRLLEGQVEAAFYSKPIDLSPLLEYETLHLQGPPSLPLRPSQPRQRLPTAGPGLAEKRAAAAYDAGPAHPADHGQVLSRAGAGVRERHVYRQPPRHHRAGGVGVRGVLRL